VPRPDPAAQSAEQMADSSQLGPAGDVLDMTGRAVIVTGGGTGIGRATALVLAARGARLVLAGRHEDPLRQAAREVAALGGKALVAPTDVTQPAACTSLIEYAAETLGGVFGLVNNAGGSRSRPDRSWSVEDWDRMLDLNLRSVWLLSRAAAPVMAERGGGAIVNIASAAALVPRPEHAPYGVAKAGVVHLTSILSAELGPTGVRVNCVAPGLIKTDGFVRAMETLGRDADAQGGRVTVGRPGAPFEIAYPVLFLLSDAAGYVHGETLYVGGGPRHWASR
jgi:NAD(P)-dependent dehydrogenase (short-subunit alcohol dehydrogenase family)